jgi:ribosome maturation factor RimP
MPSNLVENIKELALPIVEKGNCFIVDVNIRGERSSKVIELFADTDKGITLEECSIISRELSVKLDEADLIQGRYRLDVSSPGLDKPLKILRQYQKSIGKICKVNFIESEIKTTKEGQLIKVNDNGITISNGGKEFEILFSHIKETFIIPKFK